MMRSHWAGLGALIMLGAMTIASGQESKSSQQRVARIDKLNLNIQAKPLDEALGDLAQESGLHIMLYSELSQGITCPAIRGSLTADEALKLMLAHTNLRFEYLDNQTVAVLSAAADQASLARSSRDTASRTQLAAVIESEAHTAPSAEPTGPNVPSGSDDSGTAGELDRYSVRTIDEVVVTGSHIRGVEPIGEKLIIIDQSQLDQSGYGRIDDVLRSLPQNFGGNTEISVSTEQQNLNKGTEVDLRGLGSGTTLTLVNGHRQATGGLDGAFVDISGIPLAAIKQVQILPDGASAVYGSDAIGGVVNIILKNDYEGAETRARVGSALGDSTETEISQLFGKKWSRGNVMVGYEFYRRGELSAADRALSASNGDLRTRGGDDFRYFFSNPATILDPATYRPAYAIPHGQNGTSLTLSQLTPGANYTDYANSSTILPRQTLNSVFIAGGAHLSDTIEVSADGRFSNRKTEYLGGGYQDYISVPSSNPFYLNPFGGTDPVNLQYDFGRDLGIVVESGTANTYTANLGVTDHLSKEWNLTLGVSYAKETNRWQWTNQVNEDALAAALADSNPATAFNAFGDGSFTNPATLATIRKTQGQRATSTTESADMVADGPLLELPGGNTRLAVGLSYRREVLDANSDFLPAPTSNSRHSSAAFGEFAVPLVGEANQFLGVKKLMFSVAGRYECYSDFGSTFNPKYALTWRPIDSVAFRGSFGTSFRAPPFYQLNTGITRSISVLETDQPDPRSPTGLSNILILAGGNPDLRQETAKVWTTGIDFEPTWVPNLTLSATYFDIKYKNRIASPTSIGEVLNAQDQYAPIITPNPNTTQIDAVCSRPDFRSGSCAGVPVALIIDARDRNIAVTKQTGLDLTLRYSLPTAYGTWSAGMNGTYVFHDLQSITDDVPDINVIDTVGSPLALRLRGNLGWTNRGLLLSAFVNHQGSYSDTASPEPRRVSAWTTVDINAQYSFFASSGWLRNATVIVGAVNVFNSMPPFVNQFAGYDPANGTLLGRLLSAQLVKDW